ncbi:hypothetical protein LCGC14_0641580 [marine sediment metagenome]|uniref:Uncharacterized protein n=1 Tax=marine sediment metagenome TaxID=412755 RepID=A0A0F9U7G5_9ZZZZ|nr:hypothetical protein [archaeon]
MKVTQTKLSKQKSKQKWIIEMNGSEFAMFIDELSDTKLTIINNAVRKAIARVLSANKNFAKVKREYKKLINKKL